MINQGRDLVHAQLGDIIRDVALSIADAQMGLDAASTRNAEFMSGRVVLRDQETGELEDAEGNPTNTPTVVSSQVMFGHDINSEGERIPRLVSMMELGFVPTFYQFVDTMIEIKLSLRLTGTGGNHSRVSQQGNTWGQSARSLSIHASTVDAGFASSYGYSADMATTVTTKIVPIPPPAALEDNLAQLLIDRRIDINTANVDELAALAVLGQERAESVVEERANGGRFTSLADVRDRVNGIGNKTMEALREVVQI